MALVSTNFVQSVIDYQLPSFERELNLLNLLRGSSASQKMTELVLAHGPAGGFAASVVMPQFQSSTAVASTASLVSSYPHSEATLVYSELTDTSVTFAVNRMASHQFFVGDANQKSHVLGTGLVEIGVEKSLQACHQQIAEQAFTAMYNSGTFLSGTAATGADFTLTITSTATLQAGFAAIQQGLDAQNAPSGPGDRWLVLNTSARGLINKWGSNPMFEATFGGSNSVITGQIAQYNGFNVLFDNSVTAGQGIAFSPSMFALSTPIGPQIQLLQDKDQNGDYCRIRYYYGFAPLGPTSTAYAGNAIAGQKQGILRITQT